MSHRKYISSKQTPGIASGTLIPAGLPGRVLAGAALIIVAVVLIYLPSISGEFIFDDTLVLTDNPLVQSSAGLYRFWTAIEQQVYPVSNSTLWIEWRLWGMNPTGYHITNLLLHIVEALLIWLILRELSIPGAFLAALIFAVHPVNVESVAWIAQRKGLLAMLFFLLSILCYLKFELPSSTAHCPPSTVHSPLHTAHRPLFYWLSLASFVLAMLSKGSVAVLPLLLLGIIWWRRHLMRCDLIRLTPFFLVALVMTVVNLWFQTYHPENAIRNAGFVERLLGAGGVVWFYLYKALLPLNLIFVYPAWHIEVGNLLWWLPLLSAMAVTIVLWRYRVGWCRPFLFAWGYFCISLAPVLGFVDVGYMQYSLVADHYQHIALMGVIALAAAGCSIWYQRTEGMARLSSNFVLVVVLMALMSLTWRQNGLYYSEIKLYQDTLEKNPTCWMAHNNLGLALDKAGRYPEAIEQYQQALRLKSDYSKAHNNLGLALSNAGRTQEAIEHFQNALRLKSNFFGVYNNWGLALDSLGRYPEAIEQYQQALRLKPDYPEAHNNLGADLWNVGRQPEAIEHYQQALRLKPDYPDAHNNLGVALNNAGRTQEAIEHFQKALSLKSDSIETYMNLALTYAKLQQSKQALAAAQRALDFARSKKQTELSKQIEDWLNTYRASLSSPPNAPPADKSTSPQP